MPSDQGPHSSIDQALLHSLLGRVLMVGDKAHLASRSLQALQLLLPAGTDDARRTALAAKITAVVATLPDAVDAVILHKAAEACAQLMGQLSPDRAATAAFIAKATTTTQPIAPPAANAAAAKSGPATLLSGAVATSSGAAAHAPTQHPPRNPASGHAGGEAAAGHGGKAARRPVAKPSAGGKSPLPWIVVVLLLAGGGGALFYMNQGSKSEPAKRPLVAQIEAAAKGSVPPSNIFGGQIKTGSQNGHVTVTVSGVPAGECVSAGWDLTHSGVLAVNGITPLRVSAAILNELCHNDDPATMIWSPKPPADPAH